MKATTTIAVLATIGSAVAGPHKHARFHHHHRRHAHAIPEVQQVNTLEIRAPEAEAAVQHNHQAHHAKLAAVEKSSTSCTAGHPIQQQTTVKKAAKTTPKAPAKKTTAKVQPKTTLHTSVKPAPVVAATSKTTPAQANKQQTTKAASTTLATRAPQQAVAPPGSTVAGTVSGCTKWALIGSGDYCQKVADANGITLSQFYGWNPEVGSTCANLWLGYAYCVGVDSTSPPATTAAPAPAPPATTAAPAPAAPTTTEAPAPAPTTSQAAVQPNKQPIPSYAPPAPSSSAAAPAPAPSSAGPAAPASSNYVSYTGDGSTDAGWPSVDQWTDFESIWSANAPFMAHACTNNGWGIDNSDHENSVLKSSIQSVGASSGVDPRFILAIVIQESWGCVRVKTTNYGVNNPGVMQDHNGKGTCHTGDQSASTSEACPDDMINQMIVDGTTGTYAQPSGGDGLGQVLGVLNKDASGSKVSNPPTLDGKAYYRAAREYNGGPNGVKPNLSASQADGGCCTSSYASDVANRLRGWAAGSSPFVG